MANLKKGVWKMAIEDRNLTVGTRLVANYRKQAHACMVEKAEEGEGILFVLEDGRKFKSPSSAASAVMGGKAVNGWRFWSVQGAEPKGKEGGEKPETQAAKSKRLVYRVPNQKGIAEGQSRWLRRARRRQRASRHARRHDQLEGSQYSTLMVAKLDKIKNPTLRFGLVL